MKKIIILIILFIYLFLSSCEDNRFSNIPREELKVHLDNDEERIVRKFDFRRFYRYEFQSK